MEDGAELADGRTIALRAIRPDDRARLEVFHGELSAETIRKRFFTPHPHLTPDELHRFTNVDGSERLAIVALCGDEIVGVGRYESLPGTDDVEGAWVVRDDFQGLGVGRVLAAEVVEAARRHGKRRVVAETLAENIPMRRVLLKLGIPYTQRFHDGVIELVLILDAE